MNRLAALALVVLGAGCRPAGTGTGLVVTVWSDLAVPAEIDAVKVTVAGSELSFPFALGGGAGQQSFPLRAAVVPGGARDRQFEVVAVGLRAGSPVVSQAALVSFVTGTKQELVLYLGRHCVTAPMCAADSTCQDGGCVGKAGAGERRMFDPGSKPTPPEASQDASADQATDIASDKAPDTVSELASEPAVELMSEPASDPAPEPGPEAPPTCTAEAGQPCGPTCSFNGTESILIIYKCAGIACVADALVHCGWVASACADGKCL